MQQLDRRRFLALTGMGLAATALQACVGGTASSAGSAATAGTGGTMGPDSTPGPAATGSPRNAVSKDVPTLTPIVGRPVPVAITLSPGATVIDFAGPWEVFQDAHGPNQGFGQMFKLFTVAASTQPLKATAGLTIVPDYAYDDAPEAKVIVVGAQNDSPQLSEWLNARLPESDVVMSVCTGAFQLGSAGLLDGRIATTHHDFYDHFASSFPDVTLHRDVRYTEDGPISTAGGLTSGIDLALRVVDRYYGRESAEATASYMEHESTRWRS